MTSFGVHDVTITLVHICGAERLIIPVNAGRMKSAPETKEAYSPLAPSGRCGVPLPSPSWAASAWPWSCERAPVATTPWLSSGSPCVTWPRPDPPRSTWAGLPENWWSLLRTRAWRRTRSSSEKGGGGHTMQSCHLYYLAWFPLKAFCFWREFFRNEDPLTYTHCGNLHSDGFLAYFYFGCEEELQEI